MQEYVFEELAHQSNNDSSNASILRNRSPSKRLKNLSLKSEVVTINLFSSKYRLELNAFQKVSGITQ